MGPRKGGLLPGFLQNDYPSEWCFVPAYFKYILLLIVIIELIGPRLVFRSMFIRHDQKWSPKEKKELWKNREKATAGTPKYLSKQKEF
jgi:hypothetical protein